MLTFWCSAVVSFYLRGTTGERVPATGPWNHFPDEIFDQSEVEPNTDSSESSSSSSDDSGDEDGTTCSDNLCEDNTSVFIYIAVDCKNTNHFMCMRGQRIGVHIYRC